MSIHRLWLLVLALLLAAVIGPPARAQDAESMLGRYPVVPAVAMTGEEPFTAVARVTQQNTVDFSGIEFFELRFPGEAILVSADADTAFAKALRAHIGGRMRVTLDSADLQEITR